MLVSNDFAMRMLGQLIPQVPGNKSEVYDSTFESVIRKIGVHQSFIDISRCNMLTSLPYGCFHLCQSLLYLDVSYTKLNDVGPITENCTALKALNVAGIQFMEGSSCNISYLASLEVLVLRNSNVHDISWVSKLPVLRSLDLGVLSITSDPILSTRNQTRLQELLLDNTRIRVPAPVSNVFTLEHASVLRSMPQLRVLNVCESDWVDWVEYVKHVLDRTVCIEASSRRTQLFQAVAANDYRKVHRLLSTGHNIDCRATLADEAALAKIWRARGTSMKLRAPFFMVSNVDEDLRPTALHFAIYFNALECVQLLLDAGADLLLSVWFGDIKEVDGKLNENTSVSQKQPRHVLTARQLVEGVWQRNVHRLTADMVNKKVAGWKAVVTLWYKRLVIVCDAPRGGYRMTIEELDERIASMRVEVTESEDEGVIRPDPFSASAKIVLAVNKKPAKGTGVDVKESIVETTTGELSEEDVPGDSADEKEDSVEATSAQRAPPTKKSEPAPHRDKIVERKRRLFEWREHGIVEKVIGKPLLVDVMVPTTAPLPQTAPIIKGNGRANRSRQSVRASSRESDRFASSRTSMGGTSTNSKGGWTVNEEPTERLELVQLPLLGAQSHWLESRALVIRDREVAYEATVLPELAHKKDAVELALAAMATLRHVAKTSSDELDEADEANEVSEPVHSSMPSSGHSTPGVLSQSHTPYFLSPPGTAPSNTRPHRDVLTPLAPVREVSGVFTDSAVVASTASMKKVSSSERRSKFLNQLSQRIEDRLYADS